MNIIDPQSAISALPGWSAGDDFITKVFQFKDFAQAFGFMSEIAVVSEAMNHHPQWYNVYNRVDVTLTTLDAGGVTHKDITLAKRMEDASAS
jgi:4a-hydroxytetrahydrobiopterin dehydratase